jgi:peptidoglycan/xylan/chitin deacetylase (PgdA/CDA1 family)
MRHDFRWPSGRSCAVSLTYDDGLAVHHEYVGPALEARGLLGTFYVLVSGDPMQQFEAWRRLGAAGHEMGNHTVFHPCRRDRPDIYPWLDDGFDLRDYTPYRFVQELRVANLFLHLLDGRRVRTYGATCCDLHVGRDGHKTSIETLLRAERFLGARGTQTDRVTTVTRHLDLMNVGHTRADGRSFDELRDEIRAAKRAGGWLVYHVHGVGAETKELYMERAQHERLLDYLAAERDVWVQPFITIVRWIRQWQSGGDDDPSDADRPRG